MLSSVRFRVELTRSLGGPCYLALRCMPEIEVGKTPGVLDHSDFKPIMAVTNKDSLNHL